MGIEDVLNRLTKVKPSGKGRWNACCPSHKDKSPSLSLRQLDDGRILLHCFGGCGVDEVLGAIGMTLEDLFPKRLDDAKSERAPFNAMEVLRGISLELTIVAMCGSRLAQHPLSEQDRQRLFVAVGRITDAFRLAGVRHG